MVRAGWFIVILILALGLSACGSDEEDTPNLVALPTRPPVTPTVAPIATVAATDTDQDMGGSEGERAARLDLAPQILGPGMVYDAFWSSDGSWLALNSSRGLLRWEQSVMGDPKVAPELIVPDATLLAFSPDGTHGVLRRAGPAEATATVVLWDVAQMTDTVTLTTREEQVYRVVFSPDGTQVVLVVSPLDTGAQAEPDGVTLGFPSDVVDEEAVARVVDAATGTTLAEYPIMERRLLGVGFAPDGRLLLAGSANNIPALHSGKTLGPDTMVYESEDFRVRLWDAAAAEIMTEITEVRGPASDVVFSADGTRLAAVVREYHALTYSTSMDAHVAVWDVVSGDVVALPPIHSESAVTVMTLSADGTRLAAVSDKNLPSENNQMRNTVSMVEVWDVSRPAQEPLFLLENERLLNATGGVMDHLALNADGTRLVGNAAGGSVLVWDTAANGTLLGARDEFVGDVRSVAYSLDGTTFATGETNGIIRVWDSTSGEQLRVIHTHGGGVSKLHYLVDGTLLYSDMYRGRLVRVDATSGEPRPAPTIGSAWQLRFEGFSADGALFAGSTGGGTVTLYNFVTDERTGIILADHQVVSLVYTPDGKGLFSGGLDGSIRYWDLENRDEPVARMTGHTGAVSELRLMADGTLISASTYSVQGSGGISTEGKVFASDGTLRHWDTRRIAEHDPAEVIAPVLLPVTLPARDDLVPASLEVEPVTAGGTLSPEGTLLAFTLPDAPQTALLVDTLTGAAVATLDAHAHPITTLAFAPDSSSIVSAGWRGELILWRPSDE